jgi:hypothetical protein
MMKIGREPHYCIKGLASCSSDLYWSMTYAVYEYILGDGHLSVSIGNLQLLTSGHLCFEASLTSTSALDPGERILIKNPIVVLFHFLHGFQIKKIWADWTNTEICPVESPERVHNSVISIDNAFNMAS